MFLVLLVLSSLNCRGTNGRISRPNMPLDFNGSFWIVLPQQQTSTSPPLSETSAASKGEIYPMMAK
jgi:hypothetical protein